MFYESWRLTNEVRETSFTAVHEIRSVKLA